MTLNWSLYEDKQAQLQARDDFEVYHRHKSPPNPCEGMQVHPEWVEGAILDLMNFQPECCGEMIPGTADCELGGICPIYFQAKEMMKNGHSY